MNEPQRRTVYAAPFRLGKRRMGAGRHHAAGLRDAGTARTAVRVTLTVAARRPHSTRRHGG